MKLIPVWKAIRKILRSTYNLPEEKVKLCDAVGKFATENIYSRFPNPLFDQSAMDGYAVRYDTVKQYNTLKVVDEIPAGTKPKSYDFSKPITVRIFTGSPVPSGADTIIIQEKTQKQGDHIIIKDNNIKIGQHIRRKGEHIKKGQLIVTKGKHLTPATIGLLASLGISEIKVKCAPTISIILTGSELITQSDIPQIGQVFESNGRMICFVLKEHFGITPENIITLKDDKNIIRQTLEALNQDIIIITGGVSVGDYDYTTKVLKELNYEILVNGVAQKPGKPFVFAKKDKQVVFGLPGNPRSSLMSYYFYIYPFIRKLLGANKLFLPHILAYSSENISKKQDGRTHFITVRLKNNKFQKLGGQKSHMLYSFAYADGIILMNKDICKSETKKVYLL